MRFVTNSFCIRNVNFQLDYFFNKFDVIFWSIQILEKLVGVVKQN